MIFNNRVEAGRALAARLDHLRGQDVVVLGLPRGGIPVANEIAKSLALPLDVIVVRKLGVPTQPELAMGAVGEGGVLVTNDEVVRMTQISPREFDMVRAREEVEVKDRAKRFRGGRSALSLVGRVALIVDDGIATGSTARVACQVSRAHGAKKVILAVPVGSIDAVQLLKEVADEVLCLNMPAQFIAVGDWYRDFSAVIDSEVSEILNIQQNMDRDEEVKINVGSVILAGHLTVPSAARGIVVFAHGSGSSRQSTRNQAVAKVLNDVGLATLLFDLLQPSEEADRANVFDVELLGQRLLDATRWLHEQVGLSDLPVSYFGASTGAAAALWAAADPESEVIAVVSRGGRPDLVGSRLSRVRAATLLIVGGEDGLVIDLNRAAESQLRSEKKVVIISGATHLFEERGALEQVADLAAKWILAHLISYSGS